MTRMWKDAGALVVTLLAVFTFFATYEGWNVWLVGDNPHWAAAAIMLLGAVGCRLGAAASMDSHAMVPFAILGAVAGALGIAAIVTGSMALIALLTADIVALWTLATLRHAGAFKGPRASAA